MMLNEFTERTGVDVTAAEFETVARKLTGVTGYLYYHLMGEPLTHPELPLFLEMAAKR